MLVGVVGLKRSRDIAREYGGGGACRGSGVRAE